MPRNPLSHQQIQLTLPPPRKIMDLRRLLKINFWTFVICLRCQFIKLKLSLNYREFHKHKTAKAKVRRCNGEARRCKSGGASQLCTLTFISYYRSFAFATSHFRPRNLAISHFRLKGEIAKVEVAHGNTIINSYIFNKLLNA